METVPAGDPATDERIVLRYWAAARHVAGVEYDVLPAVAPVSLTALRERAVALHPDAGRLPDVLAVCSALVDEQPVGRRDPESVMVAPGSTVEFLPPFAGG